MFNSSVFDEMIDCDDRIAVGVSGGADSMLLLWLLLEKQKEVNFYLEVIHINHHLRGYESDEDATFVQNFCEKNAVHYKIIDVDVKKIKVKEKRTLEESARLARYDAIYAEMKKEKLTKLFLAHHANDQAETILMHICRGSGVGGACGIKKKGNIYRPLLDTTKKEILQICKENNIKYVVDSSNEDNNFTRNYIRNVVIPELEKVYPDTVKMLCAFGDKCFEVQNFIEQQVNTKLILEQDNFVLVKGEAFEAQNFVVREYLKIAFEKLGIYSDIEAKHYLIIAELNKMPVNSMVDLPHKVTAKKVYAGIKFYKKSTKKLAKNNHSFVIGETPIEGYGYVKVEFIAPSEVNYGGGSLYADYYKISDNAVWRFRELGDMFAKLGSGSKKLNDYFTDKKIEVDLRDEIPILANKNQVLLVAGYDIGETIKISSDTEKIVRISFHKTV